jgi:hypothetical protein
VASGFSCIRDCLCAFVIAIYWTNAPKLANPDLYRSLESELPGAQQRALSEVRTDRREITSDARFEI